MMSSDADIHTDPPEVLPTAKKLGVMIATAGVLGFAVGWVVSLFSSEWTGVELGALGFCLGAVVGGLVGRLGMKV
jgi:hypothetical protein